MLGPQCSSSFLHTSSEYNQQRGRPLGYKAATHSLGRGLQWHTSRLYSCFSLSLLFYHRMLYVASLFFSPRTLHDSYWYLDSQNFICSWTFILVWYVDQNQLFQNTFWPYSLLTIDLYKFTLLLVIIHIIPGNFLSELIFFRNFLNDILI